jgi:hypothetical protein
MGGLETALVGAIRSGNPVLPPRAGGHGSIAMRMQRIGRRLPAARRARALGHGMILLLLLGLPMAPSLAADLLQALQGRWAATQDAKFAMEWSATGDGFGLRWTVPGRGEAQADFKPTGRPGVYAGQSEQGWSMFGRDKPLNPLVKGTLYWARSTPEAVYVYSLEIDDQGAFVLDRYAYRSAEPGIEVSLLRRLPEGRTEEMNVQLVRAGP